MQIDMQHILLKTIHMTTKPEGFELLIRSCYSDQLLIHQTWLPPKAPPPVPQPSHINIPHDLSFKLDENAKEATMAFNKKNPHSLHNTPTLST